jgi:hypothetical protein
MGAADDAVAIIADVVEQAEAIAEVGALIAPCVTNLAADIDAGPGKDRSRRHIDRRRRGRGKIGRYGRSGQRNRANRGHENTT